jgi:hypothetical protein
MPAYLQYLVDTASSWDGIETCPHQFGGVGFVLSGVEIGHVHIDRRLADIPFSRRTRSALVAEKEAEKHHVLPQSGWISYWMSNKEDARQAQRLFRLSYALKRYRHDRDLSTLQTELAQLHFSQRVSNF